MISFSQYLIEAFSKPYKLTISNSNRGKVGYFTTDTNHNYEVNGIFIKYLTPPPKKGIILQPKGGIWEVHFDEIVDAGKYTEYRRNDIDGSGDAFRVFATIFDFIKKLVSSNKPEQIVIKAKMQEINRANLYAKMIKKYAPEIGYKRTNAKVIQDRGNEIFAVTLSKMEDK